MGCLVTSFVVVLIISLAIGYFVHYTTQPPPLPNISLKYWGPGKEKPDNKEIRPFKISFPESDIQELKKKLASSRPLTPPLEEVAFNYGFNSAYLNKIVEFWKTKYNWTEREAYLNQFPQFKTEIGGLDMHFIHVKPDANKAKGKQVVPILLLHGWPGSVVEFYKLIPILTTPRSDRDFVFEVVAPSLPGYGFSQGASKPGLHVAHMALIFNELMSRLGFDKYYVQGGDWGSLIGHAQAILLPGRVLGYHTNACTSSTTKSYYYMVLFYLFPSFFVEETKQELYLNQFPNILLESGYLHLQATKPDTIGVALTDSPVGLAAYILEKFSTWTNKDWKSLQDGGLENYDKTELLDNIMVYWLTKSITTSMRIYKEVFGTKEFNNLGIFKNKVTVPSGCAMFQHEIFYVPPAILKEGFTDLIVNTYSHGGHFAAFEVPEILSDDIWNFLAIARAKPKKK